MKAVFTDFLAERKAEAEAAAKAAAKEESATYRDGTDGTWLKEREDFHKAAAEADYLDARNRYLDVLIAWLADLIRIKTGIHRAGFSGIRRTARQDRRRTKAFSRSAKGSMRSSGSGKRSRRTPPSRWHWKSVSCGPSPDQ